MERQRIGKNAEAAAVAFLRARGLTILLRNYRGRVGELDIVARHGRALVVVEVRARSSDRFGGAAASIDLRKQIRIRRATALLIRESPELANLPIRFDVIAVRGNNIDWIQAAFTT